MAAPMVKTRYPGIFKRGSRYVVIYRAGGKQRKEAVGNLAEARQVRAARQADVARGEFHPQSRLTFRAYAEEWIERYQGRGRGFRESTREEYRRVLTMYAFPFFDGQRRRTLSQIAPQDVAQFVGWLCDEDLQGRHERDREVARLREAGRASKAARLASAPPEPKRLSDSTVRNIVNPIRASLATAVAEGFIRHNPTLRIAFPQRPSVEDLEDEQIRALTAEQLTMVLMLVPTQSRLMFRVMASTGLRISELLALQWRHLALDGSGPHIKVRRAIVRGRVQPPKSRHGRREVPIAADLVSELRRRRSDSEWPGEEDLVFPSLAGTAFEPRNLRRRVLAPAAEEAGVPWAGFHTFRHTCASMLFERGANAKQVQRWLGHHSAAFTLDTYIHLLDEDLGEPLELASGLADAGWLLAEVSSPARL